MSGWNGPPRSVPPHALPYGSPPWFPPLPFDPPDAKRMYRAALAFGPISVGAFLVIGTTVGNRPETRVGATLVCLGIALVAGPLTLVLTRVVLRRARSAGVARMSSAGWYALVLGIVGTAAGAWVSFLLYILLVAPPFY